MAHSVDYFEYLCQMSSKSILIILSYTASKFARFFLRYSVLYNTSFVLSLLVNLLSRVLLLLLLVFLGSSTTSVEVGVPVYAARGRSSGCHAGHCYNHWRLGDTDWPWISGAAGKHGAPADQRPAGVRSGCRSDSSLECAQYRRHGWINGPRLLRRVYSRHWYCC